VEKVTITDNISETLFINIPIKAMENDHPRGILKDPFSAELMSKLDYDFSKITDAKMPSAGVVTRTRYFDEETTVFINRNQGKNLVVVDVGAGLDTRYLRINGADLPAVFYELDLPEVMVLRSKVLPPSGNEHFIGSSMLETAWMDELVTRHPGAYFLFLFEGVVMYFPEEKIRKMFSELADRFSGEVICDLVNVWMRKNSRKHKVLKNMGVEFIFGVNDETRIASWHPKIQYVKTVSPVKLHTKRWGFLMSRVISNIPFFKNSYKLATYKIETIA
jgi:O-methyltransferase involved in polyketide biosynthesis